MTSWDEIRTAFQVARLGTVSAAAEALGVDDPLTRSIPTIWRDTPAPYGPLFLILGRGITAISGNDVVLGVLEHRALALLGVAMIVWALPRLAKRCALEGLQIMGGYGYATEYPMERYLRSAVVGTIYGGTSEIQKLVIARQLLKGAHKQK